MLVSAIFGEIDAQLTFFFSVAAWRQKLNYSNLPKLKAWQVEVNTNMMAVPARVLPAPSVIYEGNKTIRPNFGLVVRFMFECRI